MSFLFEKLDVYQKAMEFVDKAFEICDTMNGRGKMALVDQLRRASLSIPLNIAEGNGRFHQKEKKQFLRTSRGSLYECIPIITLAFRRNYIDKNNFHLLYENASRVGQMLNKMISSIG